MSPGCSPWVFSWSCPSRDIIPGGADGCNFSLLHPSGLFPAPQATTRDMWGKPSRRSQSCCSWAEKLHFPPCVLGKRPVQPRGCHNCLKQLYCCFFSAGRRQFLCFPLLDSCQHNCTTLRAFILPLPKDGSYTSWPVGSHWPLSPGTADLAGCLQAGSATSPCLQWERSSFFSGLPVRCRIHFLLQHEHGVGNP